MPRTGRFGIGFNSVYHLTELPAFVSAGKWCTFDPQAKFLPNVNPSNPGKMVDFIEHPETVQRFPDQVCAKFDWLLLFFRGGRGGDGWLVGMVDYFDVTLLWLID